MSGSRSSRSFSEDTLQWLREMPLQEACSRLGLFWKEDPDFTPAKDKRTRRVYVSRQDGGVFELLVTAVKWYDARAERGGGGAIDLAMHLLDTEFVPAVKALTAARGR